MARRENESFEYFSRLVQQPRRGPFVTAVERIQKFYFDKGIDVLKSAISVPGVARQLLFKPAREESAEFSLIDRNNADMYDTIRDNIVGGK